jgi:asparagine synthase (glutamine-hydrolysing)
VSGLCAIYHGDGRPAEARRLARMLEAIAHRGPDGRGQWIEGPVGLGHRLLFVTPESLAEEEPAVDPSGDCRIVWDGRIDNRPELLGRLEGDGIDPGRRTDPELLLAAYRRWGPACLARVLGDFAFVLWDRRRRRLFCGRDRIGLRPLHYAWDGRTLYLASEARPLAVALGGVPEPDDEIVLAFLLREFREADHARTFFRQIHRLPPGHLLVVAGDGARVERYWGLDPRSTVDYPRERDYVERFRELFDRAVGARLRSSFPVGVFLSGGLDSSAIAVSAAGFAGDGATPALEAFTTWGPDPGTDERRYARAVARATGLKGHELATGERTPLDARDDVGRVESPVVGVGRARDRENLEAIGARGCRVVLTGEGGDQLLDEIGYLTDLLARAKIGRFLRETRAFARWYGADWRAIATEAANALVPPAIRYWGKRLGRGVPPPWLNPDLARAVGLRARVRAPRVPLRFGSYAQAGTYSAITSPYYVIKLEVDERAAARAGMEFRYPFLDSRLVEFVMANPSHQRTRGGERKRILRAAMAGVVPEAVRLRRGKGDWTDSMDRALVALCRATPPLPLRDESGRLGRYLDRRGAEALIRRYLERDRDLRWEVWSLIALDWWLLHFWGRP